MAEPIRLNSGKIKGLLTKGINPKTVEILEGAIKIGSNFKRRDDLEKIGIPKDEIDKLAEHVSFAENKPVVSLKTATIETDLNGLPAYTLLVKYQNKDSLVYLEDVYPISMTDKTEIIYDENIIIHSFFLSIKAPNGELVTIERNSTSGKVLEISTAEIDHAKLKVSRLTLIKTQTGKSVTPTKLKGRLLSNNPSRKLEKVQMVIEASLKKNDSGDPIFYPICYAETEQSGYFFTSQIRFANESDGKKIIQARARIGLLGIEPIDIRLENIDPATNLGQLPEKLILYMEETDPKETGESESDCDCGGCDELDFHDKKVLDEFSFYSVIRTTEPLIEAFEIDTVDEVDLADIVEEEEVRKFVTGTKLPPSVIYDFIAKNGSISIENHKSLLRSASQFTQLQNLKNNSIMGMKSTVKGRVDLDGNNSIDWDEKPTIYQATSIAHGHLLHFKQEWFTDGYTIGDLLYSLPLAPGQKKQIVVFDWDRKDSASRTEQLDYQDSLYNSLGRDRDVNEVATAALSEHLEGGSDATTMGAAIGVGALVGPVLIGGGAAIGHSSSTATQDANRSSTASSMQHITDKTTQAASSVRSQRSTVIQTASQGERFQVSAEVVANYNHCHAMTVQYFEVLRHFEIRTRLANVQECLFIPLKVTAFDRKKALRWREILSMTLKKRQLLPGFDALERIDEELQSAKESYYDELGIPENRYAEEEIEYLEGEMYLEFQIRMPAYEANTPEIFNTAGWKSYGNLLGINIADFYDYYIKQEKQKDEAFSKNAGPRIVQAIIDEIQFFAIKNGQSTVSRKLPMDATLLTDFKNRSKHNVSLRMSGPFSGVKREDIDYIKISLDGATSRSQTLNDLISGDFVRIIVHSGSMNYRTKNLHEYLFRETNIKNDLTLTGDNVRIFTPLSSKALKKPRLNDVEVSNSLLRHLNENIEYYHQCIWLKMNPQRRFMLLDGLIAPGKANGRSVASVVENKLIGIAGNCLIMPVSPGFQLDPILDSNINLFEHYYEHPKDPVYIALPTKGVFAEAVMGKCNSCEKKDESRFWRWEESPIPDSPTGINSFSLPTPQNIQPANLEAKDYPQPIINLQNAPSLPNPEGYGSLVSLLSNPNLFRDVTGLTENQKNALASLQAAFSTAQAFGNQAANLAPLIAKQQALADIKKSGLPPEIQNDLLKQGYESILGTTGTEISQTTQDLARIGQLVKEGKISPEVKKVIEDALGKKITAKAENEQKNIDKSTVKDAISKGKDVKIQSTSPEGGSDSIEITGNSYSAILARISGTIPHLKQENDMACWAAVATMMVSWKSGKLLSVTDVLRVAGDKYLTLYNNNRGLAASEKDGFIQSIGMIAEPIANYTIPQYIDWLQTFGPLWITTDSADQSSIFSPHARILTRIEGTSDLNSDTTRFIFIDPADGNEKSESFSTFIRSFEQMISENPSTNLFIQIVHFSESGSIGEGSGPASLTEEEKIAQLKSDDKLDFSAKRNYLDYLASLSFGDALQAIFTLSNLVSGVETIKDLTDRTTTVDTEIAAYKALDDKGVLKRLQIISEDEIPATLTTIEKVETASFFAKQMEINNKLLQTSYEIETELEDVFTLKSFPRTAEAMENVKAIMLKCIEYNLLNKKHIAYMLATANGESKFLPIMEGGFKGDLSSTFTYNQTRAAYYYSGEGKQSYNTGEIAANQVQLSDYLITELTNANYLKANDLSSRHFSKGNNIDDDNFKKLDTLLSQTMSKMDAAKKWTDIKKNLSDSKSLFSEMAAIINSTGDKIITDDILKKADFYRYAGKGIVQTTGKGNYKAIVATIKIDNASFNEDLENEPEKLLVTENAIDALVLGLKHGTYGGSSNKIKNHLKTNTETDWENARKMVNGEDRKKEFGRCGKIYYEVVFRGQDEL